MKIRATLVAAGVLAMGYAAAGALADPDLDPGGVLLFLAGVLIGHDVVWMLAVLAGGAAITRLPRRHRPAVLVAAISATALTFVALPLVLGVGRTADNPSVLPLPYGRNLSVVLLGIVGATLVTCWWRTGRGRGRKDSERPGESSPGRTGR